MPYFLNHRLLHLTSPQLGKTLQSTSIPVAIPQSGKSTQRIFNRPLLVRSYPRFSQPFVPVTRIGTSLFRNLVTESTVFVDKTRFIKEFLNSSANPLLCTYPRRWGKSINLDMIKTFVEIEVDKDGKELVDAEKKNPALFSHGKIEQDGTRGSLAIFSEKEFVKHHMGKYPVISVSFKDVQGKDFKGLEEHLRFVIQELYKNYSYLLTSIRIADNDKELIRRYQLSTVSGSELKFSLLVLTRLLYQHFNQKVVVLIDEYDAPINYVYRSSSRFSEDECQLTIQLISGLLGNVLKGKAEEYTYRSLVTGILRVAKADLFSALNNLVESNILDKKYSVYYGFTEKEVNVLLDTYKVPAELRKAIKAWYNGYDIETLQIYNPWSIVNCLKSWQDDKEGDLLQTQKSILRGYWQESGSIDSLNNIFRMPLIKKKVEQLLSGNPIFLLKASQPLSSKEFSVIRELANASSNFAIDEDGAEIFFSYLFTAGYLTKDLKTDRFKIPNYEIKLEFERKILAFYSKKYNIGINFFESVTDVIQAHLDSENPDENIEEFKKALTDSFQKLLAQFPKFDKLSGERINDQSDTQQIIHANEDIIHSIMNYIVLQVKTMSKFATELPVQGKRADVVLIDAQNNKAIIIELKYHSSAQEAVKQIQERQYAQDINQKLDTTIVGLNVDKDKKVSIVAKYLQRATDDKNTHSVLSGFESKFRLGRAV